ncbi:PREDICTED: uncharacterized protein LOC104718076 [Camelina sativa]|uniref:Uncharacterized protein LOC104718076 n=1 Tax=Camelina sativa TaxID=90675 RepID=A0ABM0U0G7_CAMSA|nr:PREDICTED: uncharacterized protein LOC104718076 [Camelina sativa]
MAASYISMTQTVVSSKLCSKINSFSSCSVYTKNSHFLSTTHKDSINLFFHLDRSHQNRSTLKHYTRVRKLESEWEENKDEENEDKEKSDWEENKDEEKDVKKEDHRVEETVLKLYNNIKDRNIKEEGSRAEETVLKLYTDIKDRNIDGISEVIADECQCFSNVLSKYRLLQGKKQVMAFFYWLIMELGKDIKIIVRPTSKDGMTVGVQWQFECEKSHIQLGKGFSFHSCHMYQGKLLIKNVEMFMEPIFHVEPLRLRTMAFAVSLAEKIVTFLRTAENTRRQAMTFLLLALLLLAAAAFYFTRLRL